MAVYQKEFLIKIDMMRYHYKLLCQDTNEISASLEIRSHILYYLKGMPKSKEIKNKILKEYINILNLKED